MQLLNNNGVTWYGFVAGVVIREASPCRRIHEDDIANLQYDQTEMKSYWVFFRQNNVIIKPVQYSTRTYHTCEILT